MVIVSSWSDRSHVMYIYMDGYKLKEDLSPLPFNSAAWA